MPSDKDGWSRVEGPVEELRAIDRWDANYWRKPHPEAYEMLASVARRKRRAEILSQLVTFIPPLGIKEQKLRIVEKSSHKTGGRTNASGGSISRTVGSQFLSLSTYECWMKPKSIQLIIRKRQFRTMLCGFAIVKTYANPGTTAFARENLTRQGAGPTLVLHF
jgi:hypothetical protein